MTKQEKSLRKLMIGLMLVYTTSAFALETDSRQVLSITETQRAHVLEEMRALLSGTDNQDSPKTASRKSAYV